MANKYRLSVLLSYFLLITGGCLLFISCKSSKVTKETFHYFQTGMDSMKNIQTIEPIIKKNDLLSIQVISASLNQEQTIPFNLPASTARAGYLVDVNGNVEMPVIGPVKAAGLTQVALQKVITEKLLPYVKDPSVVIHFLQFEIEVLGMVKSPGTKKFDADRVTILDAISAAGDLADQGKREDVTVIREEDGIRKMYKVDLRSGSLFQSPAYLMQSHDILYVNASEQKFQELQLQSRNNLQRGLQIIGMFLGLVTTAIVLSQSFK